MSFLGKVLSSQVRAEIFRLLFDGKESSIHLRDLQRRSGFSIGTIQKEIAHLGELDLVKSRRDGNRLYFAANTSHPVYKEIFSLVTKTSGTIDNLKSTLKVLDGIDCAFIFGSFAKGEEKAHSDIDIFVVGEIGLRVLTSKLRELTEQTEREINPHVCSKKSWVEKLKRKDHFIKSVMSGPKIFLIGDENVLK